MNDDTPRTAKQHNAQQVGECEIREFIHRDDSELTNKVREAVRGALENAVEPVTFLSCGVWMEGEGCWVYRGALPVVIQFAKPSPDQNASEPMTVSRCPPCERKELMKKYPSRKVKRWMVIPP